MREITRAEYLQAFGLFTIGRHYTEKSNECITELQAVLGEVDSIGFGHCGDAIYGSREFPELLKLLDLKVRKDGLRKNKGAHKPKSK